MTLNTQCTSQHVVDLQRLWTEARADTTPGAPADEVLDALERKYQALAGNGTKSPDV